MAIHFGEVIFPTSRAFWELDEAEELTTEFANELKLSFKWLKKKPTCIKKLILSEGDIIAEFTKECLCYETEEACIVENSFNKKIAAIYKINEELYICVILLHFDTKLAGEFVLNITDILLNTENIFLVTWQHVSQYRNETIPNVPSFLRTLSTKSATDLRKSSEITLEQPNFVYGVAAGVLSYAQMMELRAVLYILYTDSFMLDSVTAEPLTKLYKEIINDNLHRVTFGGKNFFNKGNLYM